MAEIKQNPTVYEFTGGAYKVIKYNPDFSIVTDDYGTDSLPGVTNQNAAEWLIKLKDLLAICGYQVTSIESNSYYDLDFCEKVQQFCIDHNLENPDGSVTDTVLSALIDAGKSVVDDTTKGEADDEPEKDDEGDGIDTDSEHYDSFFEESNERVFRKNKTNLIVSFGDGSIAHTIYDIHMRSVGVEVDTSGNPIFETYEFIAKDVTDSSEPNDNDRYQK